MLLLKLTAFGLSAAQLVSSWFWPNQQPRTRPTERKSGDSDSCRNSFTTPTNKSVFSNDLITFQNFSTNTLYCYDIASDLSWSYQGNPEKLAEVIDAINAGRQSPHAPDCLIDPDTAVKGIPKSWGRPPW